MPQSNESGPRSRFLKVPAAAEYLGVSNKRVYELIWNGDIPAYRSPWRMKRADLDEWLETQKYEVPEIAKEK